MNNSSNFHSYSVGESSKVTITDVQSEFLPKISINLGENCKLHIKGILVLNTFLSIVLQDNCNLSMGSGQKMNERVSLIVGEDSDLEIGSDCLWGETNVWTTDFHPIFKIGTTTRINPPQDVQIGNAIWFGHQSLILKGANIGDNSVIAARSTVLKGTYPKNVILAGSPAKVVKKNIQWALSIV